MRSIKRIAEDWFTDAMLFVTDNRAINKPGGLLPYMPKELKDLKSEDIQTPLQREWYFLGQDNMRQT